MPAPVAPKTFIQGQYGQIKITEKNYCITNIKVNISSNKVESPTNCTPNAMTYSPGMKAATVDFTLLYDGTESFTTGDTIPLEINVNDILSNLEVIDNHDTASPVTQFSSAFVIVDSINSTYAMGASISYDVTVACQGDFQRGPLPVVA